MAESQTGIKKNRLGVRDKEFRLGHTDTEPVRHMGLWL